MRILVAPDKFAGTLTASEAAWAIGAGWVRTCPGHDIDFAPLSDGGPGFVAVLQAAIGGDVVVGTSTGPLGRPTETQYLVADKTAYIESAQACGLHLVGPDARDPMRATSYGVGEMLRAALEAGATKVVVGLGGTATTDGGAGLLAALGATARDREGVDVTRALSDGGGGLAVVADVDLAPVLDLLRGIELVAASDVDSPLLGPRGAARGFAAQKGADETQVDLLESALSSFAGALGPAEVPAPGGLHQIARRRDPAVALGAGAAGGLGYALLLLGATRAPGTDTVFEAIGLAARIEAADLVITGEGRFDWQSLRGKLIAGVAQSALASATPCIVLAGDVQVGRREYSALGVSGAYAIIDDLATRNEAPARAWDAPADALADLTSRVARTWSR